MTYHWTDCDHMSLDDIVTLGRVMNRFIHDPERHESDNPFVWDDNGSLVLDGRIQITSNEALSIARAQAGRP